MTSAAALCPAELPGPLRPDEATAAASGAVGPGSYRLRPAHEGQTSALQPRQIIMDETPITSTWR